MDALTAEGRPVLSHQPGSSRRSIYEGHRDPQPHGYRREAPQALDGGTADAITSGFKYIQDQNNSDHKVSDVFFDGLKAGIGWIEICLNDDPREEEIEIAYKDWRKIGWDPYARGVLFDDARYMFEDRWVDLDIAQQTWPEKKDLLTAMMEDARGEKGEAAALPGAARSV